MATEAIIPVDRGRRARFMKAFNRLALVTREPMDDPEKYDSALRAYDEALSDLPMDAIDQAAQHLGRHGVERKGGSAWMGFPTAPEWHATARAIVEAQFRREPPHFREEPWHLEHPECGDTGWLTETCRPGARCGRAYCDKQPVEFTHTYAIVCGCRSWNGTWRRHHKIVTEAPAS